MARSRSCHGFTSGRKGRRFFTAILLLLIVYILYVATFSMWIGNVSEGSLLRSEGCPWLNISLDLETNKYFRMAEGTSTYVYSAYVDGDQVVVLAIMPTGQNTQLFCQLWYDVIGEALTVTEATVKAIPEDHGEMNRASFIFCKMPVDRRGMNPVAVNIVSQECQVVSSSLPVQDQGSVNSDFTVCVTAINNGFNKVHQLVEMIEFNRILGADKIVFYNYSIGPAVDKVLQHYQGQGLVDVYPWNLPSQKIHYYGQLAALNDCLYQYRNRTRYLVVQDIDEFIIPRVFNTWIELINYRKKSKPDASIFLVKNTFFRREWPEFWSDFPFNSEVDEYKSVVLKTTVRETRIFDHNLRSKYIVDPRKVKCLGIHFVWDRGQGVLDAIQQREALVYHYRDWENPNDKMERIKDVSVVLRFGVKIVEHLKTAWADLEASLGMRPGDFT